MFCTKCGAGNSVDSRFCIKCGAQLTAGPAAQPAYTQTPAQFRPYQAYQPQPYQSYYQAQFNPGSKMLKVASVLFIIAGALSAVFEPLLIMGYEIEVSAAAVIGLIVACLAPIIAGIVGLRKYRDPSARSFFIIAGSVMIPLMITCIVLMSTGMYSSYYEITNYPGLASIVLPILFIVGGVRLRSHANIVVYPPRPENF